MMPPEAQTDGNLCWDGGESAVAAALLNQRDAAPPLEDFQCSQLPDHMRERPRPKVALNGWASL